MLTLIVFFFIMFCIVSKNQNFEMYLYKGNPWYRNTRLSIVLLSKNYFTFPPFNSGITGLLKNIVSSPFGNDEHALFAPYTYTASCSLNQLIICLQFSYAVIKNDQIPKETITLYKQVSLTIVPRLAWNRKYYSVKKPFNYTLTVTQSAAL